LVGIDCHGTKIRAGNVYGIGNLDQHHRTQGNLHYLITLAIKKLEWMSCP
jgi:hypothetical protein